MLAFILLWVGVTGGGDHIVSLKKGSKSGPLGVLSPNHDRQAREITSAGYQNVVTLLPGVNNLHPTLDVDELLYKGEVIRSRASKGTVDCL